MQTAEIRHLAKREKKCLEKPNGRRHLKAAVTMSGKLFADPKTPRDSRDFEDRKQICKALRKW